MSIKLIAAVLEHDLAPRDPGRRLVLVALAYHAHEDGTEARPGMERLSRVTAMVPRSVMRHLAALEAAGWIVRDRRRAPGRPTVWRVRTSPHEVTAAPPKGGAIGDRNSTQEVTETTRIGDSARFGNRHEPSIEPSIVSHARELLTPEVLPAPAPGGAGREPGLDELAKGERLDRLIAAVNEHRQPPLTRAQAVAARKLARECLEAGWDPRLVVAALAATSAFTVNALTFAVDQLRRQHAPAPIPWDRMSAAERSAEVLRRAIEGEP
jgi:hypothetical protein